MTVNAITAGRIQSAIALASSRTGIDFDYLLGQAKLESGLNATARAGTSSATGLYQFIEQSWLAVVKKHGAEHGMSWAADSIGRNGNGRLSVSDPGTRQAILNLRNDPAAASLMAAEHAGDNKAALEGKLGRAATGTDLYMAHFLGLGGASKFLSKMQSDPGATGVAMFPSAARANRNVFYDRSGAPRSLTQIYERFAAKLEGGAVGASGTTSPVGFASQALDIEGGTVVTGAESATDALAWANSTLGRFDKPQAFPATATASLMRPNPDTARLAYMMLASMGV
ncbi:lytic transglycosylase domain-containing protein [uncultured Sphingomonas sp.]|uniref:lytic transglycosylase domain-containing protein n=1 Tax=uncultured Sphingomonas sp. TaxID=158754 RepID=UPI0035CA7C37